MRQQKIKGLVVGEFPDGSEVVMRVRKTLCRGGKPFPGTKAFKPIGDGRTTCYCCGALLTDQVSFARGIGPVCIKKYGAWSDRAWIEPHVKAYQKYVRACDKSQVGAKNMRGWMEENNMPFPTDFEAI